MTGHRHSRLMTERGSILLGGLVSAAVLTLLGLALFDLTVVESRLVTDRESRTQAVFTAEAGVQNGFYQMAKGTPTFDAVYAGAGGMAITSGSLTVQLSGHTSSSSYVVTKVDNPTGPGPTTPSCDTVQCVRIRSTGNGPKTVLYPSGPSAVIEVVFSRNGLPGTPVFQFALEGAGSVKVSGGTTDGYDPSTGCGTPPCAYSNSGSTKNSVSDGDVSSNGNITLQGGTINGDVYASGTTTDNKTKVSGTTNTGVAPQPMTPVPSCYDPSATPPQLYSPASSLTIAGASYNPTTGALSMSSGDIVTLNRGTTYCFSTFIQMGGTLQLSSTGTGPVLVYTTGRIRTAAAGTMVNSTHDPTQLQFLSSCTTDCTGANQMQFSAGGQDYMTVYAPGADIIVQSGANIYGAIVGNNVTMSGGAVHFDEALRTANNIVGGSPGWKQAYWRLVSN